MKLYLVFYDDFSGVDKIFMNKQEAELYRVWCGSVPDVQEHTVNEDFQKIIKSQKFGDVIRQ